MTEQLRQYYLQAFGLESYVPRWILPNAAESPWLEDALSRQAVEPGPPAAGNNQSAAEVAATVTQPALGRAGAMAREAFAQEKSPASPGAGKLHQKAGPAFEPSSARSAQQRFLLAFWRIAPDVVVLDSRAPGSALPVDTLLGNISQALGFEALPAPPALLTWPPRNTVGLPTDLLGDAEAARNMVQAFLSAQHEKQPIRVVLLMGASASRQLLAPADLPADDERGAFARLLGKTFPVEVSEGAGGQTALVLPSLTALLRKPALKALCWQSIKPLCRNAGPKG